jgi:hypothetical protein
MSEGFVSVFAVTQSEGWMVLEVLPKVGAVVQLEVLPEAEVVEEVCILQSPLPQTPLHHPIQHTMES